MAVLIIAFSSFAVHAAGGDVDWEIGDTPQTGKQEAEAMVVDSAGNVIITGFSDDSGNNDFYTAKIKADGSEVLWVKTFDKAGGDDRATAVALDSSDNIIVTGYVWNGVNSDFQTIKYASSNGAELWKHTFNSALDGNDYETTVAVDSLNNVYIGGNSQGSSGANDFMILKYGPDGPNPDGTPIWTKSYNGSADGHDRIMAIDTGIDGLVVTGESENATPDFDCLTVKYGYDSTYKWEMRKTVSGYDKGMAVKMDSAGNVLMAATVYNGTNKDIYIAKYNASTGAVMWEDTINEGADEEPVDMVIDSFSDVYITGYQFDSGSANDMFTAKYRGSNGNQDWSHAFNSANGNNDRAVGIVVDNSGDLFVVGDTYDDAGASYNYQTLKYTKNGGTLLWSKNHNGTADKDERAAGIGLSPSGEPTVAGWSDMWTSGSSDYDYYAIQYDPGLLNPPTGLAASTASTSQIDLSWTDNASNEDGFKIERKVGDFGSYSQIDTAAADATSYNDTGLSANTKYFYRVKSYNAGDGDSYYSNEVYAVTTVVAFSAPSQTFIYNGTAGDDEVSALTVGTDNVPVVTGFSYSASGQFDYYTLKLNKDTLAEIWNARYDSDQNDLDIAKTIITDGNNDVVVSGYSNLYSVESGGNTNDIYTIKYPSAGPPESWNDQYNGPAGDDDRSSVVDVSTDESDNYVVVGYGRNADWDDDIYVIKYLTGGTKDWEATPYDGGVTGHDYPMAVSFDSLGDIIVAGYTDNGTDYDYFVRKYNGVNGNPVWTDIYNINGSGNDYLNSMALDSAGNIYVAGDAITASGNEDFYLIKYNGTNGSRLWEKSFNGLADGADEAVSVKVDPVSGDVLIAGTTLAGAGNNEFHVIRYDTDGNKLWERTLDRPSDDDYVVAMTVDLSGNVHVIGNTDSGDDTDVIVVMYDYEGSFVDGTSYDGSAGDNDAAASITSNKLGEVFAGGYITNASNNTDYLVFKINGDGLLVPTPFTTEAPDYTQIDLTWTDNAVSEDGYLVERKLGTCASGNTWIQIYDAPAGTVSYSDSGLNMGTDYCYRIQTYSNSGSTSRWVEKAVTTLTPQAPDTLDFTNNTTDVNMTWIDNTINETGFTVERCTGAGCDFSTKTEFGVGSNGTGYIDTSACESISYRYRVKAYKTSEWVTGYSNTVDVTMTAISDPTLLNAARVSETQIDLSWTDNTPVETGFKIQRCAGISCVDFAEIDTVGTDIAEYSDTGLAANTSYSYRISAYKSSTCAWETGFSNTSSDSTSVSAPTDLVASSVSTTQIDLSWTDNTVSETGFKIERCEGSGCSVFTQIDTVLEDIAAYSDTSRCEGITYKYRVRAYKTSGWDSDYSDEVSAVTDTSAAPTVLTLDSVSESRAALSWTDNSDDKTGFEMQRCTGAAAACTQDADFTFTTNVLPSPEALSYWNLNEGTGTDAVDSAGSNDGTVVDPEWTTGKYGSGLTLGSGKYVTVGDPADGSLDFGTGSFTIEAWIKAPTVTGRHYIVSRDDDTDDPLWYLELGNGTNSVARSGKLGFYLYQHNYVRSYDRMTSVTSRIDDDVWHHVAAVIDRSAEKTRFFVDGVEQGTENSIKNGQYSAITASYNDNFEIGRNNRAGGTFPGIIDEVAVHNRALSDAEILSHFQRGVVLTNKYTDTDLTEETTYTYRARSYKNATCSWQSSYTNSVEVTTTSVAAPTDVAAAVSSSTQIDLSWTDNTDGETSFEIQRCTGTACDFSATDDFSAATDAEAYSDTSVCENTTYRYRVMADRSSAPVWQSDWGTPTGDTITTAVSVPTDFTASTATETQVDLSWTANMLDETGYKIERCTGAGCSGFSEIADLDAGADSSLALYMHMDETVWDGTTDEAVDSSTYGNHGTAKNGTVTSSEAKKGRSGSYDGSDDYLEITDSASLDITSAVTMEAWVKLNSYPTEWSLIIMKGDAGNNRAYGMWVRNKGSILISYRTGSWINLNPDGQGFTTGVWHHVVGVIDTVNDYRAIYIDGVLKASDSGGIPSLPANNYSLYVGSRAGSWRTDGLIDEVAVFNRALGETEIQAHYNNGIRALTTYSDAGLTIGNVYRYRIYGYKDATCAWTPDYSAISEDTTSPPAPTDFSALTVNTTQIDLSWTDNTSGESGFKVERCTGGSCSDFVEIADLGVDVVSYSDTTVCEGITYNYRVKAYKTSEWDTLYSNESSDTVTAMAEPSGLSAARTSEMKVRLTWNDNSSDETGFKVERCAGVSCSSFTEIASLGADFESFDDSGLPNNTSYTYRVSAYKTADCSWTSAYSSGSTVSTTVSDPDDLTATTVNTTQIDLEWDDNTSTETGFKIERCTGSACSNFSMIDTVGANVSAYSDTTACNDTTYKYRILAEKSANLANDGGGCWTRRSPLAITNFERDYTTEITVTYDSDMQSDFSDIRFYDETAGIELPYWIQSKTDGVSAVVLFKTLGNNNVNMYYGNVSASSSGDEGEVFALYDPSEPDLDFDFTKSGSNPIVSTGAGGTWESSDIYGPSVIKDGSTYKMWYTGKDTTNTRIGYATSSDGITWTKDASNPVMDLGDSGEWDDNQIGYPVILKEGSTYKMWYSGEDGSNWRVGYATSSDGISWTKYASNPVIDLGGGGQWDDVRILTGNVMKEGDTYKMWFSGYNSATYRIGYATSSDGISWTKHASSPVLNLGSGWEDAHVYLTSVMKDMDGIYKMWYNGHDGSRTRVGYASSTDGISWTKYVSNPVLDIGSGGTWDDNYVYSPSVSRDSDGSYKMWYGAHDGAKWRIGYADVQPRKIVATAPSVAVGGEESSACFTFGNSWNTGYTNEDSTATPGLNAPTVLLTTAVTDEQSDLTWTDNSIDETGFKVERCEGSGCSDFAEVDTASADAAAYSDTGLTAETTYCYRIRAYKTASCGWNTVYTNESCDLTYSAHPTTLTATALNAFKIKLDWVDNANDEEGFELEVQAFNGKFVTVATLDAGVITYTDTYGIEPGKEYKYRVRAYRAADKSPYSSVATVTTPSWQEDDGTCE